MKKRTLIFSIAAIVIVLAAVPFAMAQHMRGRHGRAGMMFGLGRAKAALGLSDQQSADIKQIFTDLRAQNESLRTSMRGGRQAIAQVLLANPNDVAGAQALLDKQLATERQMKLNALSAASKALNVLTPVQRTKAAAFLQQRMAKSMADHTDK